MYWDLNAVLIPLLCFKMYPKLAALVYQQGTDHIAGV